MSREKSHIGDDTPARRLRSLRAGRTLAEFARELGTSPQNLQRYETGTRMTEPILAALARRGINLNWVLTGQGPVRPPQEKGVRDGSGLGYDAGGLGNPELDPLLRELGRQVADEPRVVSSLRRIVEAGTLLTDLGLKALDLLAETCELLRASASPSRRRRKPARGPN